MQNDEVASQSPSHFGTTSLSGVDRATTGPLADEDDPLLDLLERWEERYRQDKDATLESMDIDDPELMEALRHRIRMVKKLYAFMKLSSAEEEGAEPGAIPKQRVAYPDSETREHHNHLPTGSGAEAAPTYIGRYRVIRILGEGGFGRVHLAHDAELDRDVAIKVPIHFQASRFLDVESYFEEARIIARLSHPNIVPVYDVGRTEDGRCYIVSKYMDGGDLAGRLRHGRLAFPEAAKLIAVLSEALHYTHIHDLFHRDIKPANILLDNAGVPSLADFGLALKDENLGKGAHHVGTAAYMSPEQARGEGHRVDGRSDIFSIGIVLYELLAGRRPFRGRSKQEVMDQIVNAEARPPRQIDDTIPRELERICLKALAKRASERYSTARDLAEDLRHFLKTASGGTSTEMVQPLPTTAAEAPPATLPGSSDSGSRLIRIVPKGLSSFNEDDAEFFLELLPGPKDRDGLPDGLRFWKTRIDATDPDKAFRVGLIYGPSGCGKSSMVKAGLIPLLGPHVAAVYVEATASETESRLLRGIRKRFPALPAEVGLVESLATLRRGQGLTASRKTLLVLDQFEQWLFARRAEPGTELISALRQCDGEHLQALCLVRDDFWMAATRFMRDLEIDLVPDRNVMVVDLFDPKHARKVLAAYGRAYDTLPQRAVDLTREQNVFLDQAVAGLAQDGRVVPVRLALFAEMIRGKPWTPATLREVGGMDGVGLTFLEETFSSPRSNPNHRYHQNAAQAVLKALLPDTNADIKGRMRSVEELRGLSGYAERPTDFSDLVRALDTDLRLITPVDPEGSIDEAMPAQPARERCYQLTHDYLVHALRDWLTRKQRETRRGRAELLLEERAALWNAKPEGRRLPSVREWARIRLLTRAKGWTEPQRRMMRRADRVVALRGAGVAVLLTGLLAAGLTIHHRVLEANEETHAKGLVQQLLKAETARVPEVVRGMRDFRRWTDPDLRVILGNEPDGSKRKLHASLALLPVDDDQVDYLSKRLLIAEPGEVSVLRQSLWPYRSRLAPDLWDELGKGDGRSLLPAAGSLALYDPDQRRWAGVAGNVARAMVSVNPVHVSTWLEILRPVEAALRIPLKEIFRDPDRDETDRVHAATYLVDFAADSPTELVDLLMDADSKGFAVIFPSLARRREQTLPLFERAIRMVEGPPTTIEDIKDRRAERQSKAAAAMVRLGAGAEVWPLLAHSTDPRLRSFIIHWLARLEVDPGTIQDQLRMIDRLARAKSSAGEPILNSRGDDPNRPILFEESTSICRALILALGHFDPERFPTEDRRRVIRDLLALYRDEPDAGIHGAAEWALRRWRQDEPLRSIDRELARMKDRDNRRWYINPSGLTMVIVEGPLTFRMGSPETEPDYHGEILHNRRVPRRFAIASKEVSVEQFKEFWEAHSKEFADARLRPDTRGELPRRGVNWYIAAAYCNWLSRREGLTEVYEPNQKKFAAGMRVKAGAFDGGGYRLPTEAEWEYACRSGTETSRYYGFSWRLLSQYARLGSWDEASPLPCGSLLPNDLGLFDMLGNVDEWCHDGDYDYLDFTKGSASDFLPENVINSPYRVLRGASYTNRPPDARSADRSKYEPGVCAGFNGFRPARTCTPP